MARIFKCIDGITSRSHQISVKLNDSVPSGKIILTLVWCWFNAVFSLSLVLKDMNSIETTLCNFEDAMIS